MNKKKLLSVLLCTLFCLQQTMLIPVLAAEPTVTNITGVTGVNGTFNVNPTEIHGSTGFRNYDNFDVAKGDVANMIFGSGYDKFINLVGNQVNIYGILNSTNALGQFANGHAIFVTPQGMVVGASGVINVGALSVFTPPSLPSIGSFGATQKDIDKVLGGLESGNQGVITINGKIFAREGVNLYGKDITVAKATGSTVTPTILAGIKDDEAYNKTLTTAQQAETLFNALVNTDGIAKGDAFANENGTLVIKAQDSAEMAFNVDALTTFSPALELGNLGKAKSSATVTISDAILAASSMDISAESEAIYATESAIAPGVLASLVLDLIDYVATGETSSVGYVGAKSNATVNITNSKLTSSGDININSSASSSMTVSDSDIAGLAVKGISVAESAQQVLYSFGTETNSEVNIKNSTIKATEGDVRLYAGSSNSLDISMSNQNSYSDVATDIDSAGKSSSLGGAKVLLMVTHTDANTKVTVDKDSTILAENVIVAAVNATSNSIETTASVDIGESDDTTETSKTYNTVVTVDGVLNVTNVNTTAQVAGNVTATKSALDTNTADNVADKKIETKVGDETTTTYTKGSTGNVNVVAQNVYISSVSASAETGGKTEKTKTTAADSAKKSLLESITGKFNSFIEKSSDDSGGGALSKLGFGGAAVINISNINAKAEVTNTATVKADRNLNITANTLDLTVNNAAASVSGAKYSPAVALIVNVQHDTTTAQIADGTSTAGANIDVKGDININSTTEMPLNLSTVAAWIEIFSSAASIFTADYWTKDTVSNIEQTIDTVCGKVSEIGDITSVTDLANTGIDQFGGFFNNYAKANSDGESLSIGGSIIVSVVDNTTKSYIGNNANITVGNYINLNSSNFIVYNNLAGLLSSLSFGFFKDSSKEAGTANGVGGSLIIGVNNHTANSSIGNSVNINVPTDGTTDLAKAAASNTDINLNAGTIANYINIAAGGSTGSSLAATGSIIVTYVGGSTITGIGNNNKINANSLTLNSGVATIRLADTNFNLTEDSDSTDAQVSQVAGVDGSESTSKTEGDTTTTTYNNNYGFLDLKNTTNVYDQTNIINFTGALSVQRGSSSSSGGTGGTGGTGGSGSSSGGTALGASINVAVLNRNLNSTIGNNNTVTLGDSLNVSSNTSSVIANAALAGSFTGGASPKKPAAGTGGGATGGTTGGSTSGGSTGGTSGGAAGGGSTSGGAAGGSSGGAAGSGSSGDAAASDKADAGGWQTKVSAILDKITGATDSSKSDSAAGKTSAVNPNAAGSGANSEAADGLKTSTTSAGGSTTSGSDTIGSKLAGSNNLNSTGTTTSTATKNLSVAAAGSINGTYTSNTVSSSVGNSSITTGANTAKTGNVAVNANQSNVLFNLSTGVGAALKTPSTGGGSSSSSSTSVGAGAALNLSLDQNKTSANIGNATSDATDTTDFAEINSKGSITVGAEDTTVAINAAVGVGATSSGSGSGGGSSTSVAIGGSFNASYLGNGASSYIGKNAKITNSSSVAVNSELSTILLNAAGGINVSATTGSSGSSVGAGIAANINVFTQETDSEIMSGANITSTGAVGVNAKNQNYDISAGIAGSIVTGGQNSYTFTGAIGTDVIVNATKALIDGATINSKSLSVMAENDITNYNLAGSITFSASQTSYGVGVGAIVDVNASTTQAGISNSTITSTEEINVKAMQNETLRFLALNGMVSTGGGSGFSLGLNGIVDVLASTVDSYITNSTINSATNSNVISTYNTSMAGITGVGGLSTGGSSLASANLVANVLVNTVNSRVENSDITESGKLTIKSDVDELIDIIPVAVSISSSGSAAVAANIVANIIVDSVNAKLTGKKTTTGQVASAGGVEVNASDDTTIRVRGGTLSATGGSAGVGGSILIDVLVKSVNASINDGAKVVASNGNVDVKASAENIFGVKSDVLDSANSIKNLTNEVTSGKALSDITDLLSWEMTFDVAGGNNAGVSGSLIAKTIVNSVSSSISNADVTAKGVNVLADNATYIRAIVGNITGGGTAAVGGSFFVNTLVGSTVASIDSGASVVSTGTDAKTGDVNLKANSTEDVTTVMAVGGGAGTVAVNGSLNVNTIVDTTKATINSSKVVAAQNLNVEAAEHNEISTLNLSVSASGSASVGVVGYVNTFADNVEASIVDSTSTDNSKYVQAGKDINVKATGTDNFGGVLAVAAASGAAGVAGLVVVNTVAANIDSYISNSKVTSSSGLVNVIANYDYNKTEYGEKDITNFLEYLSGDEDGSTHKFSISDVDNYIPIVGMLNVTGSAYASVGVTLMANTVISSVDAYVTGSTVSSQNGLNVKANTDIVLYNAMATMAFAGVGAAVPVSGLVNTLVNSTTASIRESTITGSADVEANQLADLNSIIVGVSVVGVGGAVSGNILTNVIASTTTANIKDSVISNANSVKVLADSEANVNNLSVAGAGSGIGGTVTGTINTTVLAGSTNAYIADMDSSVASKSTTISANTVDVEASSNLKTFDLITAATVSGVGADVGVNIATNVIVNGVYAYIDKADLNINSSTTVKANSDLDIYDTVANCGINLVGASVAGTIITNVVDNNIVAHASNSTIIGGSVDVEAEQDTTLGGGIISINAGGLSVAASAHAATNVLIDNVSAFIDNSTLTSNTGTKVKGTIKENIAYITMSGAAAGLGGVAGSVLTNVIATDLNAYTSGGSISSSGAIDVEANTTISLNNISGGVQAGAIAVGARSIVNVLTNKTKAYMDDTAVGNSGSITVKAASNETIYNNNYSASGGGSAAGIGVVVNVIENDTEAYIDADADNVNTSGALSVTANDTLSLQNIAGIAAVSSSYSGSASININVINNAVLAELKGTTGTIFANAVDVSSSSTMALDTVTASASGGLVGVAGAISITSIGDRISSTDSDYNTYTSDYTTKAKDNSPNQAQKVDYNHDGTADYDYTSYSNAQSLDAGANTAKEGTVANIAANVTSKNAINVTASNTVKGLSDDTFNVANASVSGGVGAGSASILVTDMNYKTTAEITGGTVKSTTNKAINVSATNTIKAETDAVAATVGAVGIGGNVAVVKNKAKTTAKLQNATLQTTGAINVLANSSDGILTRTVNGTAGLAALNFIVALSKTNNETSAIIDSTTINGGSASVSSGDLNVKATNTSSLKSDMESATVGGYSVSALVNLAYSDAITSAVISGTSDIYANSLNLISQTGGISAESIMHVGSLSYFAGASVGVSGATVNATFNSTVGDADGSATKIKTAGDTTLKAGVNSNNNALGGNITAQVSSTAITAAGLAAISVTTQNANANANTNIRSFSGSSINSGHDVIVFSALNRTATTGSTSGSIGTVSIGALTLDAETAGTSNIALNGSTKAANNINIDVKDTNIASASMFSATASLAGGSATIVKAIVNSNASITTGSMEAASVDIDTNVARTASSSGASGSISGASISVYTVDTEANGSSTITLGGASSNVAGAITADINDTNTATANAVSLSGSALSVSATVLRAIVGSAANINTAGTINANSIALASNASRTTSIGSYSIGAAGISLSGLFLDSQANGSTTINMGGALTSNSITATVLDTNTSAAQVISGSFALLGGSVVNIYSTVGSNATITTGGILTAPTVNARVAATRNAYTSSASTEFTGASLGVYTNKAEANGNSKITLYNTNASGTLNARIDDNNMATTNASRLAVSGVSVSSSVLQALVGSTATIETPGIVLAQTMNLTVNSTRTANVGTASLGISGVSMDGLIIDVEANGSSTINLNGALTASSIAAYITDTNNSIAKAVSGSFSLANASALSINSIVGSDSTIATSGSLTSPNVTARIAARRNAVTSNSSTSFSGVSLGAYSTNAQVTGDSTIALYNTNISGSLNASIGDVNTATAHASTLSGSIASLGLTTIAATVAGSANIYVYGSVTASAIALAIESSRTTSIGQSSVSISGLAISGLTIKSEANGSSNINVAGSLTASSINARIADTNNASALVVAGSLSLISGSSTSLTALAGSNTSIGLTGTLNANTINLSSGTSRTAYLGNSSSSASLANLSSTNMNSTTAGSSTITLNGNIRSQNGTGRVSSLGVSINDASNASNSSVSSSLAFIGGSSLNINSTVSTGTNLTVGGNIWADSANISSTVNRTAQANAASSSAGLFSIGAQNLSAIITGGSYISINGTIDKNETLTINSTANNTVQTYLGSSNAGLLALSRGYAQNYTNTDNKVVFGSGTNIYNTDLNVKDSNITGNMNVSATTNNHVYMASDSSSAGFVASAGGTLYNTVNSTSGVIFNSGNVTAGNLTINSTNKTDAPNNVTMDDYSGGFIAGGGGTISSTINQTNDVQVNNSAVVTGTDTLKVAMKNSTNYAQYAKSDAEGAGCYNEVTSRLTVNNTNTLSLNGSSKLQGNSVTISEDVVNNLRSDSHVSAKHFAGDPTASAYLNVTNTNNVNVNSSLLANDDLSINLMTASSNVIAQKARAVVDAAVATSHENGSLNYNSSNNVNVGSSGTIASGKNVNIRFSDGYKYLDSELSWDETSYLLFGIPINVSGSRSSINNSSSNNLVLNGTIQAGSAKTLTIFQNSDGTTSETGNIVGFTKSAVTDDNSTAASLQSKINALQILIDELNAEKSNISSNYETTYNTIQDKVNTLQTQYNTMYATYSALLALNNAIQGSTNMALTTLQTTIGNSVVAISGYSMSDTQKSGVTQIIMTGLFNKANVATITNNIKAYLGITGAAYDAGLSSAVSTISSQLSTKTVYANAQNNTVETFTQQTSTTYNFSYTYQSGVDKDGKPVYATGYSYTTVGVGSPISSSLTSLPGFTITGTTPNYTTYGIYDNITTGNLNSSLSSLGGTINSTRASLSNYDATAIANATSSLTSQIATYQGQINDYTTQKVTVGGLGINNLANGSYVFSDLSLTPGGINISGVYSVTGSGSFVMNTAGLAINNYSNYNLIFNNISLNGGTSGVTINGYSYGAGATGLGSTRVVSSADANANKITINNFYDASNPLLDIDTIGSNIVILGSVTNNVAGGEANIFNDSENIIIKNGISSPIINLLAPQGNISVASAGTVNLSSSSNVMAGKDVTITAANIVNNGKIKAGITDRNIFITHSMIADAISNGETFTKDGVTYCVINPKGSSNSSYLNVHDNIKLLLDPLTQKILVYDMTTSGGSVTLNGAVSGSGLVTYTNGYSSIVINNQTEHQLVVNNLANNYCNGTISPGVSAYNTGASGVNTRISSEGAIEIKGKFSSGNHLTDSTGGGATSLASSDIITIDASADNNPTVDVTGDLTATSNGNLVVNGKVNNKNGLTVLTNASTFAGGIVINDAITTNGGLTLDNYGPNGINIASTLTNNGGNLQLINEVGSAGSVRVNNIVSNTGTGLTFIANNGEGGITINSEVSNDTGYLALYNTGLGNIQINSDVTNNYGGTLIINNHIDSGLESTGVNINATLIIQNNTGYIHIVNSGNAGINILGKVNNLSGGVGIDNSAGGVNIAWCASVTNQNGNIEITNSGANGISINGVTTNSRGNTIITNGTGSAGGVNVVGTVQNNVDGNITITNNGAGGVTVASTGVVNNTGDCDVTLNNAGADGVIINGNVLNNNGTLTVANSGVSGINIIGTTLNKKGNTIITNNAGAAGGITINGTVENLSGSTTITNNGIGGVNISGSVQNKAGTGAGNTDLAITNQIDGGITITSSGSVTNTGAGNTTITNNGTGGITVAQGSVIANEIGKLTLANAGLGNVTIAGALSSIGGISISNTTTSAYGIEITSTGTVTNDVFDLDIHNYGTNGITIAGVVSNTAGNMSIINETAGDIVIGNASTDNNLTQDSGNVLVSNNNGNILNAGNDTTLINLTNGNLTLSTVDGNIGTYDTSRVSTLANKYGIEAATRDYTETFNVNVSGTITALAKNSAKTDSRLINLRAKNSDINIDKIDSDGDILLTAADWADSTNDSGYSITNASSDPTVANITGKNISLISSKNIGSKTNWITLNQTDTTSSWVSAEAEKDLYIKGLSDDYNMNIWAMVAKTGSMGLELSGNTVIREISAGGNLQIVNRGAELTLYDVGRLSHMLNVKDDLLYPHDKVAMSSVTPETLDLEVLDINKNTRVNANAANSILRIYNAYVKGQNAPEIRNIDGTTSIETDITLRADNIYANKDGSSMFIKLGNNNTTDRKYHDNPLDTSSEILSATGFNSVGEGKRLVFDVQGVSPDLVTAIGRSENERNYYSVDTVKTIDAFQNIYAQFGKNYMAKNVTLSINSNDNNLENRGSVFNHLYSDFAYVDTMDKRLTLKDTVIDTYAEFRNGNGQSSYKWTAADDNRPFHTILDFANIQLYTEKTGSFYLSMNDTIVLGGNPPVVNKDDDVVVESYDSEESFVDQLRKDTTIQHKTTTSDYDDIDKDTYKPTQRTALRFTNEQNAEHPIADNDSAILGIKDISTTGVQVKQDGSLKVGDKRTIIVPVGDETVSLQIQIVRTSKDGQYAGAKFMNMDQATANKLLYFKMQAQAPIGGRAL